MTWVQPLSMANPNRSSWMAVATLSVLALLIRLVWHGIASNRDWPDTASYLSTGNALLNTGLMNETKYMPVYPLLISTIGYDDVLWLQFLLSAASVGLIALLAQYVWQCKKAVVISGVLAAVYPLLIFYANMRLTETVFIFLILAGFVACYRGFFGVGSFCLVLSILTRPAIDLIAPLLIVLFSLARGEMQIGLIIRRLIIYGVIYIVLMAPWWLHNQRLYGEFVRLNLADGVMMMLESNKFIKPERRNEKGIDWEGVEAAFNKVSSMQLDLVAQNRAMKELAWQYITEDPVRWGFDSLERFWRFWSPTPGSPLPIVNTIALFTTAPIFLAALLSIALMTRSTLVRLAPIFAFAIFLTAVHTVTHAYYRYRLPLDPFLIVLAGGSIAVLLNSLNGKWTMGTAIGCRGSRSLFLLHQRVDLPS